MTDTFARQAKVTGRSLTCDVESIFPFGIFVRLPDGRRGYIRRRELTLSGDKDPREVVTLGQQLQAAPIEAARPDKSPELSVRAAMPNPWPEFARQHRVGDVIAATVKRLFAKGVLVEIVPGVDGYIPLRELAAIYPLPAVEDILWTGDHVEAVIIALDPKSSRLTLSIRRQLEKVLMAEAVTEKLEQAGQDLEPATSGGFEEASEAFLLAGEEPIEMSGPILIVEDRADLRESLSTWLEGRGCAVYAVPSAKEAVELCRTLDFAIGLFDLDIPKTNGVSLIQMLRELQNDMPIAVMSGPDLIKEEWSKLQPLGIVACFPKPLDLDDLAQTLMEISHEAAPQVTLDLNEDGAQGEIAAFRKLTSDMRAKRHLAGRLDIILNKVKDDASADKGFVFHMAPGSVTITAEAGKQSLNRGAVHLLPDSPVKDVIFESTLLIEHEVSRDRIDRFKNLLALIPFESCIGIPLEAGGRTEDALFLFSHRKNAFPQLVITQALSAAFLMEAALESQILEQRLDRVSGILLSGQLSSAFGHEVFNRVSSLELQMRLLSGKLGLSQEEAAQSADEINVDQVRDLAAKTGQTVFDLKRTVGDFQRLMRITDEQSVDVNHALRSAEAQIQLIALRKGVRMYLDLAADLPHAKGNSIRIQQVFLNLILNAFQQMEDFDPRRRILRVISSLVADDGGSLIQIRFVDLGPGIHRLYWEKVFALGFTTREGGSGLGLFIARSLVESFGGSISIEESRVLMGTTFLVELPVAAQNSESQGV